jgi:hypothetical protein
MIDLSSAISYQNGKGDDVNINTITGNPLLAGGGVPLSGYSVSGFGIGSSLPIGYEDPKTISDGVDTAEAFAGRRILTVQVDVYGSSRANLFQNVQNIINLMRFMPKTFESSDGFRKLSATMITTDANFQDGEIKIHFLARPLQIPQSESTSAQFSGSDALGYSTKMLLYFLLKYPYKYADSINELVVPINNTNVTVNNYGAAPADLQIGIESTGNTARTDDLLVTVTVDGVPLELNITQTAGLDGSINRSWLIDYSDQVVYTREQNTTTLATTASVTMNLININSGALFATVEPLADLAVGTPIKVRVQNASTLTDITTGYTVTAYWREKWF